MLRSPPPPRYRSRPNNKKNLLRVDTKNPRKKKKKKEIWFLVAQDLLRRVSRPWTIVFYNRDIPTSREHLHRCKLRARSPKD
jgi:hypothetical protein